MNNPILQHLVHQCVKLTLGLSYHKFIKKKKELKKVQLKILNRLFPNLNYQSFLNQYPLTDWSHWEDVQFENALFYQPTSGSTNKRKWIPYTKQFLIELDYAIAPWVYGLYSQYPEITYGKHYWSLSWLPNELRDKTCNDDLKKLSWTKRIVMSHTMAVPSSVQYADTSEASQLATVTWLASHSDLTFVSIWSPSYLLVLVDLLFTHKAQIAHSLKSGQWQMYSSELKNVRCPRNQRQAELLLNSSTMEQMLNAIWPKLKVISCWHSSDAKAWANKLQLLFSKSVLHPKGLFATEGVVTIPVDNQLHLAYQSHFYEFLTESGKVIPSWELAVDMRVSPIITTGGGLIRYRMFDWLKVVAKNDDVPILEFLGREATVDMVGEKIDFQSARDILNTLGDQAYCLIANFNELNCPYYAVLWQSDRDGLFVDDVLDSHLNQFHHYKVARELGQLSSACRLEVKEMDKFITKIKKRSGQVMGDQKLESIVRINTLEELIRESI